MGAYLDYTSNSNIPSRYKRNNSFIFYAIAAGIISILYCIMFILTPTYADDLWYLENSIGEPGSLDYFLSTIKNCYNHWQYDTGRLSNMVAAPFLSLFPKWIYAAITSFAVWIIYMGGPILTNSKFDSYATSLWVMSITFVFPWFDFMFGIIFSINYVWAAAILLLFLYWFKKTQNQANISIYSQLCLFFISYILGWWHEGLSVPLIISLCAYFIIRKQIPNRTQLLMLSGLTLGIFMILCMPAFWNSTHARQSVLFKPVLWETLLSFAFISVFYLYVLIFICMLFKQSFRSKLMINNKKNLAICISFLTFGLIGSAIYLKYYVGPRVGCFVQFISTIAIMYLCHINKTPNIFNKIYFRRIIISLSLSLAFINMTASVINQKKLTKEFTDVLSLMKNTPNGNSFIFYDQTPRKLSIDLFKPSYKALNTPYGLKHGLNGLSILPQQLSTFYTDNPSVQVCSDSTLYIFKNYLLTRQYTEEQPSTISLLLKDGRKIRSRIFPYKFKDRKGAEWIYIKTVSQTFDPNLKILDAEWCY